MNHDELSTHELEALAISLESEWTALAFQSNCGNTPKWEHADESINTQDSSIHGKGQ
jgi:hypothetical protein